MRVAAAFGIAMALAAHANAQELEAIRPGLMCHSAAALATLTLPNGDSRTHRTARPADSTTAAAGGCIDIPLGARVTVLQAFHNTSIVTYGPSGTPPYVIPNIDFQPGGGAPQASAAGYAIVQRIAITGPTSGTLVLKEDRRLTPKLRQSVWGYGGNLDMVLPQNDPLLAETRRRPLLNARLEWLSPDGKTLAETGTTYPLAKIDVAPIHGLPAPAIMFTVDESAGFGGFSGPVTTFLSPATTKLAPIQVIVDATGKTDELGFMSSLHSEWQIAPARHGATQEIESAHCPGGGEVQVLTLRTDRFRDGQWHRSERRGNSCNDLEVMPPRNAFP